MRDREGASPDQQTGELVEKTTYLAFGGVESDFRPTRWQSFREPYKHTGKENDLAVGLTYFGARYFSSNLGRWASADPLAIHGLGADLNPYAYVHGDVFGATDAWGLDDDGDDGADDGATAAPPPPSTSPSAATTQPLTTGDITGPTGCAACDNDPIVDVTVHGERPDRSGVGAPGFKESLIPVWGSGRESVNAFQNGHPLKGAFFGGLALTDVFLAKSIVQGGAKLTLKALVALLKSDVGEQVLHTVSEIGCFSPGTEVVMCDGSEQPIETLRTHDWVQAENEDGSVSCHEVLRVYEHVADDRVVVTISGDDEENGEPEELNTTAGHRFWVEGREWVPAAALAPGDAVRSLDGAIRIVESVVANAEPAEVWNLDVEGAHTYFVGRDETLVHNGCSAIFGEGVKDALKIDAEQFGKKIGKHAADYGLDPSNAAHRALLRETIESVASHPDQIVQGTFKGQSGLVDFMIKGSDVVVAKGGEFVTLLKDGINNPAVRRAMGAP